MQTDSKRNINPTRQYDHLFPPAKMTERLLINRDEKVEETIDLMRDIVFRTLNQTEKIAEVLHRPTTHETCRAIWNFIYNHIQYEFDSEHQEELRTPARTWADRFRGVDCDCMSIFASSILTNLNIPHDFRITAYKQKGMFGSYCGDYQHVYVIAYDETDQPIIIDCVTDRFNFEVKPCKKKDMAVAELSGVRSKRFSGNEEGIGDLLKDKILAYSKEKGLDTDQALQKLRSETSENGQKVLQAVTLSVPGLIASSGDMGAQLKAGMYEGAMRSLIKNTDGMVKAAVNAVIPGAGEILGTADGLAKMLGFDSMRDMWFAPIYAVLDLLSDAEEREPYLAFTIQSHQTDMMVYLIGVGTDKSFDDYKNWACANVVWGEDRESWMGKVRNMMRDLFDKTKEIVIKAKSFGLPDEDRAGFFAWAKNKRGRMFITGIESFWTLGMKTDGTSFEKLPSSLKKLYTWVYMRKGDPCHDFTDMWKYCGQNFCNVVNTDAQTLVLSYMMRLKDPTREPITGRLIYYKDFNDGKKLKPVGKDTVITPIEIYWGDYFYFSPANGVSGFSGSDPILVRDGISQAIGINTDPEYIQALVAVGSSDKNDKSWIYLLLLPTIGVGVGALLSTFKKN